MTAIAWYFGTYAFEATSAANEPESFQMEAGTRPAAVVVPRRHGSIVQASPFLASRTLSLRGSLSDTTLVSLLDKRNDLHESLLGSGRQKLQEMDDRYIYATCVSLGFSYPIGAAMLMLNWWAEFVCDTPFWEAVDAQPPLIWTASSSKLVNPQGKAPSPPVFTITISAGTLTAFSLSRDSPLPIRKCNWAGSQGVGSLIVDMDAMTIKDGTGANRISGLSAVSGENDFWSLLKGNNTVTAGMTGTGLAASTAMVWRSRWY